MIKKISKLDKIGKFSSITQERDFKYGGKGQNCNIIFGFNGSGKTTISNIISFFADNSFISEEEKKEVFDDIKNDETSIVELSLQDNSNIKYPNNIHCKNFYVFNSNFVTTHVFDGTKGRLKKFLNIGGEIKNKDIDSINQQIKTLEEEKEKLEKENAKMDNRFEEIKKKWSQDFNKTLLNSRLMAPKILDATLSNRKINTVQETLDQLKIDYELSKKQDDLSIDLGELRQLTFNPFTFDFEKIDEILSKNIQQLSKDVLEKKITEIKKLFSDEQYQQSVELWFKYGKDVLEKITENKEKKCPICDTDISQKLDSLLQNYRGYFDESYENFISEMKIQTNEVSTVITSLDQCEKNAEKLDKLLIKYEKLLKQFLFEKFDFSTIKNDLTVLEKALIIKNNNIQSSLTKPTDINDHLIKMNGAITKLQNLKRDILSVLESKKLNTNTIESNIRQTYNEIIVLEFNDSDKSGAIEKYRNNKKQLSIIEGSENNGLPSLRGKLREELKKIKAESKSISAYLVKMGIDHFDIDINENEKDENIIIKYKNSVNDKNKLRNCLSDGEKTALAFAYFLSKFENEITTPEKLKNSVVVIDDPISSLDDNRLYSTAHLIWHKFEEVKQLIVLSHNFLFLKFFNSFYYGKANCLFLDNEKITDLPEELKNFETPYFYMLKTIVDFLNQKTNYNEVKRYLPNFTRRVLETFLSFKFAKISSSKHENYSPGIDDFDDNIQKTSLDVETKKDLISKIKQIKDISDKFSHGNLQHMQENFYISETDLKTLAQNTMDVIDAMDKLHKTCFINNQTQ
ncbi:MAG: AAA family ATPase [Bacilli bacterium]|nr:AAA family ATPase [Bacilli bacterium]